MSLRENRRRWLFEGFSKYEHPNLNCPKCYLGQLTFKKDWAKIEENSYTKTETPLYFSYHPDMKEEYFTGFAFCSNTKCQEPIAITGYLRHEGEYDGQNMQRGFYPKYLPKFFFPSLSLIKIGERCPPDIKTQIEKSFSHFFNDRSACANSIRTALELIMNEQEVRKTYITKKRERKDYTLHKRIEIFGNNHKDLEPFLIAAKWIGNAGSHVGEIDKEGLLDGYELLEHCLDELYEKKFRLKELKNKALIINKTKKPVKSKSAKS